MLFHVTTCSLHGFLLKNYTSSHVNKCTAGILALQIHQGMNLQVTAAPYTEESSGIMLADNQYKPSCPNPYVVIYLNDSIGKEKTLRLLNFFPELRMCERCVLIHPL